MSRIPQRHRDIAEVVRSFGSDGCSPYQLACKVKTSNVVYLKKQGYGDLKSTTDAMVKEGLIVKRYFTDELGRERYRMYAIEIEKTRTEVRE